MNLTTVFYNIDDFCREFTLESPQELLPMPSPRRNRRAGLGLSEIMTILVMFHHSGEHRNFKGYYSSTCAATGPESFPERRELQPPHPACPPRPVAAAALLGNPSRRGERSELR
jgi:hypothetical protein